MSASENQREWARPFAFAGVSMRELLAAGVAAKAVSTPPPAPEPGEVPGEQRQRKAA
jgi:hypothetical protein